MVKGIGVDISNCTRFEDKSIEFLKKIFTEDEISQEPEINKNEYYASRFAAKEAFVKALGTGFRTLCPKDIEISVDDLGKPFIRENEKIKELIGKDRIFLSISHEKEFAVAMVVLDG